MRMPRTSLSAVGPSSIGRPGPGPLIRRRWTDRPICLLSLLGRVLGLVRLVLGRLWLAITNQAVVRGVRSRSRDGASCQGEHNGCKPHGFETNGMKLECL
jgi:hypothetical protein